MAIAALIFVAGSCLGAERQDGEQLFLQNWTSAETASDGLGPLYNEASCNACHWFGSGARIRVRPNGEVAAAGVLVRLTDKAGRGDLHYGAQVQNKAVAGLEPEAVVSLRQLRVFDDLNQFVVLLRRRQTPALMPGHTPSLRAAPALDAAGLVERVPEQAILARHDPDDADGDGISGRAHMVRMPGDAVTAVGRFNWKATQPGIAAQVSTAFQFDMGLGSSLIARAQGDCTALQTSCIERAAQAGLVDVTDEQIAVLRQFMQSLANPVDDAGLPSPAQFLKAGCDQCHVPSLGEGSQQVVLYSDLLLHDMGQGLTSHGGEGDAGAREWRTTPLVGWRGRVPEHRLLHDGRAATIDEAIRWHGGEASRARDSYAAMTPRERLELTSYVHALMSAMPLPPVAQRIK